MSVFSYENCTYPQEVTLKITPYMTQEETVYFYRFDDFEKLLSIAWKSAEALAGAPVETVRQSYASILFDKLVAHSGSLARLLPGRESTNGLIWDVSSVSAIARCIMDAYGTLAYLSLDDVSADEMEFRFSLLKLHDADRRFKVVKTLGSDRAMIELISGVREECRAHVKQTRFFKSLSAKEQEVLINEPRDLYRTRQQRNDASGINNEFYLTAWIYLSQFTHSHGFAIHQLYTFTARTDEAYRAMGVPVMFASAFLAKGVQGMRRLFKVDDKSLSPDEHEHLSQMAEMTNGFPSEEDPIGS